MTHNSQLSWLVMLALLLVSRCGISQEPVVPPIVEPSQSTPAVAAEDRPPTADKTEFLRLRTRGEEPLALEVACVTYAADTEEGVTIDLIGAVHVGERSYYDELNARFDDYDVVLYELVAPEGTQIPLGGQRAEAGFNPLALIQDSTRSMLGLESQLERIDYTKSHFVRADMTPQQIAEKMDERGETVVTLLLSTVADAMRQQNRAGSAGIATPEMLDISLADMLGNPLKMKRVLAQQFASSEGIDQALGTALNQLLIKDRNQAALSELQKQIAAGKKRIGIFYGAAHMPDLEQHLVADFGLRRGQHSWLTAWDLAAAQPPNHAAPLRMLIDLLEAVE